MIEEIMVLLIMVFAIFYFLQKDVPKPFKFSFIKDVYLRDAFDIVTTMINITFTIFIAYEYMLLIKYDSGLRFYLSYVLLDSAPLCIEIILSGILVLVFAVMDIAPKTKNKTESLTNHQNRIRKRYYHRKPKHRFK